MHSRNHVGPISDSTSVISTWSILIVNCSFNLAICNWQHGDTTSLDAFYLVKPCTVISG